MVDQFGFTHNLLLFRYDEVYIGSDSIRYTVVK